MRRIEIDDSRSVKEILADLRDERAMVIRDGEAIAVLWPIDEDEPEWITTMSTKAKIDGYIAEDEESETWNPKDSSRVSLMSITRSLERRGVLMS